MNNRQMAEYFKSKRFISAGVGVFLTVIGFILVSQADPLGAGWAAKIGPLCILGGMAAFLLAVLKGKKETCS